MTIKTIIITGTHHTPAIETIKQLQEDKKISWNIFYFHDTPPHDDNLQISLIHIPCGKYNRNSIIKTIISLPKIFVGFLKSVYFISKIKPDFVLSFGGYVSVPTIVASRLFSIPSITHEQTLTISLATKINSYFVNKVALSFPLTTNNSKYIVTGNVLRREIFQTNSTKFTHIKKPFIYITGGNQGSSFINSKIIKIISKLPDYIFIHQTGKLEFSKHLTLKFPNYFPIDYIKLQDIGWVLNNASLIISRAGANTCQEIAALNQKSIIIPLPFAQQNEQLLNAQWLLSVNPHTIIIPQSKCSSSKLLDSIKLLESQPETLKNSPPHSQHPLVKLIYETI